MSTATQDYIKKEKILAVIDFLKGEGTAKDEIIQKIMVKYHLDEEAAKELFDSAAYCSFKCGCDSITK